MMQVNLSVFIGDLSNQRDMLVPNFYPYRIGNTLHIDGIYYMVRTFVKHSATRASILVRPV